MTNHTSTSTHHLSASKPVNEAQAMFDSEIHFMLFGFWDGGVGWYLGGSSDATTFVREAINRGDFGNEPTIEAALVQMANQARATYPQSHFTFVRPTDISMPEAHVTLAELIEELARLSGAAPSIRYEPEGAAAPASFPFTVHWDDDRTGYMGSTPEEAVVEAITQLRSTSTSTEETT